MKPEEKQNESLTSAQESVYEVKPEGSVVFNPDSGTNVAEEHIQPAANANEDPGISHELPNPVSQPAIEGALAKEELPPASPVQEGPKYPSAISLVHRLRDSIIVLVLLTLGIAAGIGLRAFLLAPKPESQEPIPSPSATLTPTPSPISIERNVVPSGPVASGSGLWRTYTVLNGKTMASVTGFSFELPEGILQPVCDGSDCASQGTYLPSGTRFTVAARGEGQILPDFRGSGIADVAGRNFISEEATVAGRLVTEFRGDFSGTTVGGYQFIRMRGVMIPLTEGLSIEVNHFSPKGITTDFGKDDLLFEEILSRLVVSVSATK